MPAQKLSTIMVEKPWGRTQLWPGFDNPEHKQIGEIWFEAPEGTDPALMVKYLFTSERLSIQVHPDDAEAQRAGYERGKDEAWLILDAAPDSTIALGTTRTSSREELRAAALDGSIETLVDWRRVRAEQTIYSPAGTVHAIGADLTLIEVQQNVDLTYRLYDYGRPRELHLDAGIPVTDPVPFTPPPVPGEIGGGRAILCEGLKFVMERWSFDAPRHFELPPGHPAWLVQVAGEAAIDGAPVKAGECWMIDGGVDFAPGEGSDVLFAYEGTERLNLFVD